jgi:hypothetical protein
MLEVKEMVAAVALLFAVEMIPLMLVVTPMMMIKNLWMEITPTGRPLIVMCSATIVADLMTFVPSMLVTSHPWSQT